MTRLRPMGVYVHFPFCLARCPYCDFATHVAREIPHRAYADAVLQELDRRLAEWDWGDREVVSVYFGGGTPSLWEAAQLGRVIEGVARRLPVISHPEVTVEANPGIADGGRLADLRATGANRISFGTQSFQQATLAALGRWHEESDSLEAVDRARAAGFQRVSVDLIYGAPGQTPEAAAEDARRAAATGPDHVSAYALTLEPHVPMARAVAAGRVVLPDEEGTVDSEDALSEVLAGAGLRRYEISNYAHPGREAVHNSLYWTGAEYLGLGVSASGFVREAEGTGVRWTNLRGTAPYLERIRAGGLPTDDQEHLGRTVLLAERMFTGLRLVDGVDLDEVTAWAGLDPREHFRAILARLVRDGFLEQTGSRLRPTRRGLRFNDHVAVAFL